MANKEILFSPENIRFNGRVLRTVGDLMPRLTETEPPDISGFMYLANGMKVIVELPLTREESKELKALIERIGERAKGSLLVERDKT